MIHDFKPNRQIRRTNAAIRYLVKDQAYWLDAFRMEDRHLYFDWIRRLQIQASYRLDRARARYARRYNLDWFEGVPASHV